MSEVAGLLAVLVTIELYQLGVLSLCAGLLFAQIMVSRWGGGR